MPAGGHEPGGRVVVFGEMLVDAFPDREVLGGAPLNVAMHLQRFGLDPVLVTRIGEDAAGDRLLERVARAGLDTRGVQRDATRPTGRVAITFEGGTHRFEIVADAAYDAIDADAAVVAIEGVRPRIVCFGTLAQRGEGSRRALDAVLEAAGGERFLDINLRAPYDDAAVVRRSLGAASHLKLNEAELRTVAALAGVGGADDPARARAFIEAFGLLSVVVTCGADGAWWMGQDGRIERIAGRPLEGGLVDTVGAGDGFAAVVIEGLVRGWGARETLERADAFARRICQIHGAIPD